MTILRRSNLNNIPCLIFIVLYENKFQEKFDSERFNSTRPGSILVSTTTPLPRAPEDSPPVPLSHLPTPPLSPAGLPTLNIPPLEPFSLPSFCLTSTFLYLLRGSSLNLAPFPVSSITGSGSPLGKSCKNCIQAGKV